jgi:DNA-binding transcriptional LysR family regulator
MELRQLTTFVAVAEERSFTRAGERLGTAQSAVSATIRRLEADLEIALFERTTHRVTLSDAGAALLPEARRTLAAAAAARDAVDRVRGGLGGTITLGTMQAQAMRAVSAASVVAAFRQRHPGVRVLLRQSGSADLADMVADGRVDLAFVSLPAAPTGVTLTPLAAEPIRLVCPVGHRLAARTRVELAELVDEPFAELPPAWGTRIRNDQACAVAGVRRRLEYEVNDTASVIDLVRHGLAVALLPASMIGTDSTVVLIALGRHAPTFATSVAHPSTRPLGAAAQALLDAITARAA